MDKIQVDLMITMLAKIEGRVGGCDGENVACDAISRLPFMKCINKPSKSSTPDAVCCITTQPTSESVDSFSEHRRDVRIVIWWWWRCNNL